MPSNAYFRMQFDIIIQEDNQRRCRWNDIHSHIAFCRVTSSEEYRLGCVHPLEGLIAFVRIVKYQYNSLPADAPAEGDSAPSRREFPAGPWS